MPKDDYDLLRKQYPEVITLEQMYRICRIAKRTAKYLLDHGTIPCSDSGKKTRRYKIKLEDVIVYLKRRGIHGTMVTPGAVSSKSKHPMMHRESFVDANLADDKKAILDYFKQRSATCPDVLSISDVVSITGLQKETLRRYLHNGTLKSLISDPRYLIPKTYLLEFITSPHYLEHRSNSKTYHHVIGGFQEWKTAKSSQS